MSNMEAFNKISSDIHKQLAKETITDIKAALETKDEPVQVSEYRESHNHLWIEALYKHQEKNG